MSCLVTPGQGFKFLRHGRQAVYGSGLWTPYRSRSAKPPLRPCEHGVHYCSVEQLSYWHNAELWRFEDLAPETTIEHEGTKLVTSRGRITTQVEAWRPELAIRFGFYCAERAKGHAVAALRAVGLNAEAEALSVLPEIVDVATAWAAQDAARAAGNAARAAQDAARAAENAARAAEDAVWAAGNAAWVAEDAVWAAQDAARAAENAARAARAPAAWAAEYQHLSAWIAEECGL